MLTKAVAILFSLIVLLAIVSLFLRRNSKAIAALAAASIGLVAGALIGLSSSPIIGATVSAVLGALSVLIAEWIKSKAGGGGQGGSRVISINPGLWIPLALCLGVGALLGIVIRANDLLSLEPRSLREYCVQQGFSEEQVSSIMSGLAAKPEKLIPKEAPHGTGLLSTKGQMRDLVQSYQGDPSGLIKALSGQDNAEISNYIKRLGDRGKNDAQIAEWFEIFLDAQDKPNK